jgi:molybdopterin/thiamine biosynthesis adenylyltransferase
MSHVIVVGAGAIGSFVLPHVARLERVSHVTIVDRDRYDATNLASQDISLRQVGRSKAVVQARRLRRIRRNLAVTAVHDAVENLPLGRLRAAVILACLDSRLARMVVNQAAWRLGVPWIDAGVNADSALARVRVLVPTPDAPCLECGWDQGDYSALEQRYPCQGDAAGPPTRAPSMLGALAASLQAAECDKLLAGDTTHALDGRDVLIDTRHHRHFVTAYRRNPACRMPDHGGWQITAYQGGASQTTLEDLLAIGSAMRGAGNGLTIGVAGQRLASELRCSECGDQHPTVLLERQVRKARCPRCGGRVEAVGIALYDSAPSSALPGDILGRRLSDLGVRTGDVITLRTPQVEAHFELGGLTASNVDQ